MTESDQEKRGGLSGGSILGIVAFSLIRNVLEEWLIEPVALAIALLIVFPLMYPLERRKVSLARWLLFSCLLAILTPAAMYGIAYLLCGSAWGAIIYGLLIGVLTPFTRYIVAGLHGEPAGSLNGWILTALFFGIAMGTAFHYVPEAFCPQGR